MIILTNCLTETADEGCLKVVNNLTRRIKASAPETTVVSCGRMGLSADIHIPVNKLMLSRKLKAFFQNRSEPVLYLPSYARMLPTMARVFLLSLYTRGEIYTLLTMKSEMGWAAKILMKASRGRFILLSSDTYAFYQKIIGERALYLKTGVDTDRFMPAAAEEKAALRRKYHLPEDKPIVLHVGHMKRERNLEKLLMMDERFHVLLVVSSTTLPEQDLKLRSQLEARENITIIDSFVPQIQELYQLSDVYFFPVEEEKSCIDVPLSALEAAACGVAVAATPYGELRELLGCEGFYQVGSFEERELNDLLWRAAIEKTSPRQSVMAYSWKASAQRLIAQMCADDQRKNMGGCR